MIKNFLKDSINLWYFLFPINYLVGVETEDYHVTLFLKFRRIKTLEDAEVFEALVKQELKNDEFNVTFVTIC
jgi:hypothetical protein